jgi:hypothetical protein
MATIVGNKKYGEGHKVILKEANQIPATSKQKFASAKYTAGKSVFSIVTNIKSVKVTTVIELAAGKDSIYLKDDKNKVIMVTGSAGSINNTFNHFTANSKSDTRVLTEVKENISMWLFQASIESGKTLKEDEIIAKLGANKKYYDSVYYESGLKQLKELKKVVKKRGYEYERQGEKLTKGLYNTARTLSKKANDNWNPADVWMIKRGYDMNKLAAIKNLDQLNTAIAAAYKKQEIIPISLKQVTGPAAKFSVVDPASQMNQKLDYDLKFEKVDLSDSFNNFIVQSKSGFAVRCGFKASATTLNVSLEGRMIGAGYQMGAVDAKQYGPHCQKDFNYTVRSGVSVSKADYDKAKEELKEMFKKYPRLSNTIKDYDHAIKLFNAGDKLTKDRFANLISYMYSFMIAPKGKSGFEDNMKYCYFSSKKITTGSCLYAIIQ